GFDVAGLRRLAGKHGFTLRRVLRRPAMRPLREAMTAGAQEEESALIREERCGWIELTFRLRASDRFAAARSRSARSDPAARREREIRTARRRPGSGA